MRRLAIAILVLGACGPRPAAAPTVAPTTDAPASRPAAQPVADPNAPIDLSADLEKLRADAGVPALLAIVIDRERVVAQGATGVRRIGAAPKVAIGDAVHLGSDTKAITAFVAARLVEAGAIGWDTTAEAVWPELKKRMNPKLRKVTLEQLLQHRAGLPANVADASLLPRLADRSLVEQRRVVVEAALAGKPVHEPGTVFEYSNTGYILAGAMLETETAKSWEELVREHVLSPFAMSSCGFGPTATQSAPDGVWAHAGKAPQYLAVELDNPAYLGPAGTLHCSLGDWAAFVRRQLVRDETLLSADTWARLHRPMPLPDKPGGYAMGWGITELPWAKGTVLAHDGSNTMNYVGAMLLMDQGVAVLVASNAGDEAAQRVVVTSVLGLAQRFGSPPGR